MSRWKFQIRDVLLLFIGISISLALSRISTLLTNASGMVIANAILLFLGGTIGSLVGKKWWGQHVIAGFVVGLLITYPGCCLLSIYAVAVGMM